MPAIDYQEVFTKETGLRSENFDHRQGIMAYTSVYVGWLENKLAAIEVEKPDDDAIDVVERIYELYGDNWTKESIEVLQCYTDRYHERKCAECKKGELN